MTPEERGAALDAVKGLRGRVDGDRLLTLAARVAEAWTQLDEPTRDRVRWVSMRLGEALDVLTGNPDAPSESAYARLLRYLENQERGEGS